MTAQWEVNENRLPFTPVIIIGAGRSGTNALRDALVRIDGFATWPCDEINPIWRHGNIRHPNDELPASAATPKVRKFVRRQFYRIWQEQGQPKFVVEKTCANALRVPFVDAILPEARYIYIVRNGTDVVASAARRWRGELEINGVPYFLSKARYSPISDLPFYAIAAIWQRLSIWLGLREHMVAWGPRAAELKLHAGEPVEKLCARQWAACIESADEALEKISDSRVLRLTYEVLTVSPVECLKRIVAFLGADAQESAIALASATIRSRSANKGRVENMVLDESMPIIVEPLKKHGYL